MGCGLVGWFGSADCAAVVAFYGRQKDLQLEKMQFVQIFFSGGGRDLEPLVLGRARTPTRVRVGISC